MIEIFCLLGFSIGVGGAMWVLFEIPVFGVSRDWGISQFRRIRNHFHAQKRVQQWPDALFLLSGALQSGLNMEEALALIQKESPEPLKIFLIERAGTGGHWTPLSLKIDRLFDDPLLSLPRAALRLSHVSGGRAASLMKTSATLTRQKLEMREKINMLTAQTKLTAWVVGSSPFGFLFLLLVFSPEMVAPVFGSFPGWILLGVLVFLVSVGLFFTHKMARIEP